MQDTSDAVYVCFLHSEEPCLFESSHFGDVRQTRMVHAINYERWLMEGSRRC